MALTVVPACAPASVRDTINRAWFLGAEGPSDLATHAAWLLDSLTPQDTPPSGHVAVAVAFRAGRTDNAVLLAVPMADFMQEAERSIAVAPMWKPAVADDTGFLCVGSCAARRAREFALIVAGQPEPTPRGAYVYGAPEAARNLCGTLAWAVARLGLLPALRGIVTAGDAPAVVAAIHAERPHFEIEAHVAALPAPRANRA